CRLPSGGAAIVKRYDARSPGRENAKLARSGVAVQPDGRRSASVPSTAGAPEGCTRDPAASGAAALLTTSTLRSIVCASAARGTIAILGATFTATAGTI